jgi:apolipoprotein N-acyltransferase
MTRSASGDRFMGNVALRFLLLWGWKRLLVAALFGALAATAMPPASFLPALFIALPVLVWLIDGALAHAAGRARALPAVFMTGWAFGFGYFAVGLHWIYEAFLVEADTFAWMIPFVTTLLPLWLALFWGLGCAAAALLWAPGPARILALGAGLAAAEWLRGHAATGFPWNALGYAATVSDSLAQAASFAGIYGLTLLLVVAAASPAVLADEDDLDGRQASARWGWVSFALALLAVVWAAGAGRLAGGTAANADGVRLRIVQPDIPQALKWSPENRSDIFARLIELSGMTTSPQTRGLADATHLVWPESAMPFLIEEQPQALAALAALLPEGRMLIAGALRRERDPGDAAGGVRVFNSILAIDAEGRVAARYDKWRLVPFGEFLPLERWLGPAGLRRMVSVPAGFAAGERPATIELAGTPPFAPLVCYEAIFPHELLDRARRPSWLLNVTNDAWFGTSIGPRQHFAQARFRAIEEGLPLVRAANTGISAVIDPYGRVVKSLGLGSRGVIDAPLPAALAATPYARFGDWLLLALLAAAVGASGALRLRQAQSLRRLRWQPR